MIEYMRRAYDAGDFATAHQAARDAAPYLHPRLHSVEAKTETTVVVASADELREKARQAIRRAFQEREVLTAPKVIEHDDEVY